MATIPPITVPVLAGLACCPCTDIAISKDTPIEDVPVAFTLAPSVQRSPLAARTDGPGTHPRVRGLPQEADRRHVQDGPHAQVTSTYDHDESQRVLHRRRVRDGPRLPVHRRLPESRG